MLFIYDCLLRRSTQKHTKMAYAVLFSKPISFILFHLLYALDDRDSVDILFHG